MKIGQFSKNNQLSIDTVRYYQDLGLLIPIKVGGQYDFDDRCQKDLEDLLTFKNMGFTLNEISTIFTIRRLGKLSNYQENAYYKEIFIQKYTDIQNEIKHLNHVKNDLSDKINQLNNTSFKKEALIGIDLSLLPLLKCPHCKKPLSLIDGEIKHNKIINGHLKCDCHFYKIIDGILTDKDHSQEEDFNSIINFIKETPSEYLINLYKDIERRYKYLDFNTFKNKTILEVNVGYGYFLRQIYQDLPDSTLYIAVEPDFKRIKILKHFLEYTTPKNVNFICCDFLSLPLQEQSIDLLVDNFASFIHGYSNPDFLLTKLNSYLKEHAYLLGIYAIFKKFSSSNAIKYRKNVTYDYLINTIKECGFKTLFDYTSEKLTDGGLHENFFDEDDHVYRYFFYGKR